MDISMIGIDFGSADVSRRERFALTASKSLALAQTFVEVHRAAGCVVLSTCNRTEVWCSGLAQGLLPLFLKETGAEEPAPGLFSQRYGEAAVRYLLELGCGMHSQIFGEDQILAQLKEALQHSHEAQLTDAALETLFRTAVTAAKQVKTSVRLSAKDRSVPGRAVSFLEERYGSLAGKRCLVIGNGEMGRLTCERLMEANCEVLMTLRRYRSGEAVIPQGCGVVPYEDRYQYVAEQDFLFSATLSPHHTLEVDRLTEAGIQPGCVLVDFAVPRDIAPEVSALEGVTLIGMDMLGTEPCCDPLELQAAQGILEEAYAGFAGWYTLRRIMPTLKQAAEQTALLTGEKLEKPYRRLSLQGSELHKLQKQVQSASQKAVQALLLGAKEHMMPEEWERCISALEKSARELPERKKG